MIAFSCNFYNNNIFNQSLKYLNNMQNEKDYINEYKIFLENLNHFSQEYNNYKLVPIQVINNLKIAYIQKLSLQDIDNTNINSKPYLFKALYFCEDYVLFDKDKQALFDENIIKELEFDSSFYTIFHKAKLNDTYLQARKALYKSIDEFKRLAFKDLEHAYETYMNSLIINKEINSKDQIINKNKKINKNLNQESKENTNNIIKNTNSKDNTSLNLKQKDISIHQEINNTNKQNLNLLSYSYKSLNHFILENKNKRIIFLNNASSMSDLIHLYENHCDIFIKDGSLVDIQSIEKEYGIEFKKLNTRVFFYEKLLLGAKENNEFLFEDQKENVLYYYKYNKEDLNSLQDLNIKYNYYNAKIKNYSLLEESLNIKLEPKEFNKELTYKDTSFNQLSKQALHSSTPKEPCFITLYLKDEHNKPITHAKIIIKGFRHNEVLKVVSLKRLSDEKGRIRFDKEKYFSDCYSFKVKLDEEKAYFPTPLQNAKRIFNNYIHHKKGLILKFKVKDHLVYDGFNVYHYKGNDLIHSYMARSGIATHRRKSNKQIAPYPNNKKAYFYYDDTSSLPEGKYYLKMSEITKDTNPSFLKDYPFEIVRTWGRYCVRLYTNKECSKTSKEIKENQDKQIIIKDNLYLYTVNEKGEFGSNGSIGMAQAQLLENLSKQAKFIQNEEEDIILLKVAYPEKIDNKIIFVGKTHE